ncbi:helix-turn-helix domain-containing protein [Roseibium sp.]|uniref:helix-turn-helix transcriptional regulator n=1 Tax=Roseibium sp. TaxID=1936156 RepID=UPI003A97CA61
MPSKTEWMRSDAFRALKYHSPAAKLDWRAIAELHKFDPAVIDDPEGTVPITTWLDVFEHVAQELGSDAIMFDIFNKMDVGAFSVFDYLFICAPTLRDACKAWKRFMPMRTNAYGLHYHEDEHYGILEWPILEGRGIWCQSMYARIGWAARRFEIVLETDHPPIAIELATPAPKDQSDFLERYGRKVRFNRLRNCISIPAYLLSKRLPQNEDNLYAIIQTSAFRELGLFQNRNSPMSRVANEIAETLKNGTCNLAQIAQNLGMSQRSVQRVLEQEGTTFRKLTEDIRKTAAERYLQSTDLPFKEIAFLLGFSELSTFSRAVKTWYGVPPRKIRESGTRRIN